MRNVRSGCCSRSLQVPSLLHARRVYSVNRWAGELEHPVRWCLRPFVRGMPVEGRRGWWIYRVWGFSMGLFFFVPSSAVCSFQLSTTTTIQHFPYRVGISNYYIYNNHSSQLRARFCLVQQQHQRQRHPAATHTSRVRFFSLSPCVKPVSSRQPRFLSSTRLHQIAHFLVIPYLLSIKTEIMGRGGYN